MGLDDFRQYNRQVNKNLPSIERFKPELPSPDTIYYKDFHFLDEPLINRKIEKEEKITTTEIVETKEEEITQEKNENGLEDDLN